MRSILSSRRRPVEVAVRLAVIAALAWAAAAGPAVADRPLGIDVSQFQGDIDWNQVYAGGRVFAFIRSSHGSLQDPKFTANMNGAYAAGVLAGAYHFAVPVYDSAYALPGADPQTEANRFLQQARPYIAPGYLRPVLDVELGGGQTPVGAANLSAWSNAWIDIVEQETGVEAIVYCSSNYARNYLNSTLAARTLWIANWTYPSNPHTAQPTAGTGVWPTWTFWQYSNNGNTAGHPSVPGVPARVDLDAFNGTLAQLQNHVITRAAVITPAPALLTQTARHRTNPANQTFTLRNTGTGGLVYQLQSNRDWLTVSPTSGFVKSGTATITVSYTSASLPPGLQTATVSIIGALANNSPQNVEVQLRIDPVPGDFNADGYLDGLDVSLLLGCLTGPEQGPPGSGCGAMDLDGDRDVDQSDFARLQVCLSGSGIAADPYCME